MKGLLLVLCTITAFALQALSQESLQMPAKLEVSDAGHVRSFDEPKHLLVTFWFQQLMLSALYRDVVQESSLDEWQQRVSSPSRIYCRYPSGATLAIPERRTLAFDEALLPLPSDHLPDYIFIRRGQHVFRLAKFDPWVLYKLVSEAGFSLYEQLSTLPRGLF